MFTYLVLNLIFLTTLIFFLPKKLHKPPRYWWITLGVILTLTLIFDPMIIAAGIVDYNPDLIVGVRLFGAPIEDFFYAIYAVCLIPLVWNHFGERNE